MSGPARDAGTEAERRNGRSANIGSEQSRALHGALTEFLASRLTFDFHGCHSGAKRRNLLFVRLATQAWVAHTAKSRFLRFAAE